MENHQQQKLKKNLKSSLFNKTNDFINKDICSVSLWKYDSCKNNSFMFIYIIKQTNVEFIE